MKRYNAWLMGVMAGWILSLPCAGADAPYRYYASTLGIKGLIVAGDHIDLTAPNKASDVVLHNILVEGVEANTRTYLLLQLTPDQIKKLKSAEQKYDSTLSIVVLKKP